MPSPEKLGAIEAYRLSSFYEKAEMEIVKKLNTALMKNRSIDYLDGMLASVRKIKEQLKKSNKEWCEQSIPHVYTEALYAADAMVEDLGIAAKAGFGGMHQQAAQVLAENTYSRLEGVTDVIGRRVEDIYRNLALETVRGSVVGYDTWAEVARNYRESLADQGVTGFTDRSGKKWNMSSYAKMVARTTTMEAHLQGTTNRLLEQGFDLVKVSTHIGACDLCVPWQGKVLSLSGQTEGYPTLEEARKAGLFHPNCRHAYGLHIDLDKEYPEVDETLPFDTAYLEELVAKSTDLAPDKTEIECLLRPGSTKDLFDRDTLFSSAMADFTAGFSGISELSESILKGTHVFGSTLNRNEKFVVNTLDRLQKALPSKQTLYRLEELASHNKDLKVGDTFIQGIRSYSRSNNWIERVVSGKYDDVEFDKPVLFEVKNCKSLNVKPFSFFKEQEESITAGTFKVVGVQDVQLAGTSVRKIILEQQEVVPEPAPVTSKPAPVASKEVSPLISVNLEWRKDVEKAYEQVVAGIPGMTLEEAKKIMTELAQEAVKPSMKIRVRHSTVSKILNDGQFRTQFETGKSGGKLDNAMRAECEHALFGIDKNLKEGRPIYGYISTDAPSVMEQYGDVVFVLKDSVKSRATFTDNDSLTATAAGKVVNLAPTPVNDVSYHSMSPFTLHNLEKRKGRVASGYYNEVQIFGGVSIADDIEEVIFTGPKPPAKTHQKILKQLGIPFSHREGYEPGDPAQAPPPVKPKPVISPEIKVSLDWQRKMKDEWDSYEYAAVKELGTANFDEAKETLNTWLNSTVGKEPLKIRARHSTTTLILQDGRFKSQFETQTSGGMLNNSVRAKFEEKFFGIKRDEAPEKRPIYGYVVPDKHGSVSHYGDVVFILKEEVKSRATFTFGDSLDDNLYGLNTAPTPMNDLSYLSLCPRRLSDYDPKKLTLKKTADYGEIQIFGGVSVKDVAEIIFTGSNPPNIAQKQLLQKLGIPYSHQNGIQI